MASSTLISNPRIDVMSSFFLHHLDNSVMVLVSQVLTGDNYPLWRHAMKIALLAKNKIDFIEGSLKEFDKNSATLDA